MATHLDVTAGAIAGFSANGSWRKVGPVAAAFAGCEGAVESDTDRGVRAVTWSCKDMSTAAERCMHTPLCPIAECPRLLGRLSMRDRLVFTMNWKAYLYYLDHGMRADALHITRNPMSVSMGEEAREAAIDANGNSMALSRNGRWRLQREKKSSRS